MLAQANYYQKAHRIQGEIADSVKEVHPGQLFQKDDEGKWEYADGTKKAYPTVNHRFSPNNPIGLQMELLEGRDNVTRTGLIACLKGNYEIGTDMYDKNKTFEHGKPVTAGPGGKVVPFDTAAASPNWGLVVGYVTHVPVDDNDMIRYEG